MTIYPYLVLVRPANIITAVTDILAGVAIAGSLTLGNQAADYIKICYLVFATIGLYAGGIVFNDIFDIELDRTERPERPLPKGIIPLRSATIFAVALLVAGVLFAFMVSARSGLIAVGIVASALLYDKYAKHHLVAGPLVMGLCRGLNLLLGMSIFSGGFPEYWPMCFLPVVFIAAVTLTSQGEVSGNNRLSISLALAMDLLLAGIIVYLGSRGVMNLWQVLPFILLWITMNFYAKLRALIENVPANVMNAVKMGVLSLIPLNASYVAGFSSWQLGLAVLLLLFVSVLLGKKFNVT